MLSNQIVCRRKHAVPQVQSAEEGQAALGTRMNLDLFGFVAYY